MIDVNLKEFNYCLRHHTNATLRKFNLKDVTPRLKRDISEWEIHEGWAGLQPEYTPELEFPAFFSVVFMKDYPED